MFEKRLLEEFSNSCQKGIVLWLETTGSGWSQGWKWNKRWWNLSFFWKPTQEFVISKSPLICTSWLEERLDYLFSSPTSPLGCVQKLVSFIRNESCFVQYCDVLDKEEVTVDAVNEPLDYIGLHGEHNADISVKSHSGKVYGQLAFKAIRGGCT